MKRVFSAFTLYANVLGRVKVAFDGAQRDSVRERIQWEPLEEKGSDAFRRRLSEIPAWKVSQEWRRPGPLLAFLVAQHFKLLTGTWGRGGGAL